MINTNEFIPIDSPDFRFYDAETIKVNEDLDWILILIITAFLLVIGFMIYLNNSNKRHENFIS